MEFKFDPIEEIVELIVKMKETISAPLNLLHLKISIAWHRKREA